MIFVALSPVMYEIMKIMFPHALDFRIFWSFVTATLLQVSFPSLVFYDKFTRRLHSILHIGLKFLYSNRFSLLGKHFLLAASLFLGLFTWLLPLALDDNARNFEDL